MSRFKDWMKEVQAKLDFMGLTTDKQKISLLGEGGGDQCEDIPRLEGVWLLEATKKKILMNRDWFIIDLVHRRQNEESWMAFIHDLEVRGGLRPVLAGLRTIHQVRRHHESV